MFNFLKTLITFMVDSWQYMEPAIWYSGIIGGGIYYLRHWLLTRKKHKTSGKDVYIALQIGRPVAQAVNAYFKLNEGQLNIVDIEVVLNKTTLETAADYKKLAIAVYKIIEENQFNRIHLVLSGPVGLNFLIGQMVGLHHYDVTVYQFNPVIKGYQKLPVPNRNWLS